MSTPHDDFRLTPEAVKVLAHPLRSRLLGTLRRGGPATATTLATALSTNSGATSYHLRKLESVGLVADTGEGSGKQRLWRAATDSHSWERTELSHDEDATTALGWLERDYLRLFSTDFGHWLDVAEAWPGDWQDATGMGDSWVTVAPDQLKSLRRELDEVMERYRDADPAPDGRRVIFWSAAYPLDPDDVPGTDTDTDTNNSGVDPDAAKGRADRP